MNRLTRLVAEREVREALRRKTIWISAAVLLLGGLALTIVPELIGDDTTERTIATVGEIPPDIAATIDTLATQVDVDLTITTHDNVAAATAAVVDDDVDYALIWDDQPRILQATDGFDVALDIVQRAVSEYRSAEVARAAGIDSEQLAQIDNVPPIPVTTVDAERDGREGAAFALTIVMYMVILMLASTVASSVAAEKSSRVSEVLLAVVPARSLLYGKVLGVSMIGLAIVLIGAAPILIKTLIGGDLPAQIGTTIVSSGLWLTGGIAIYLLLAAMLGSLVDRTEEVGGAIAPITISLIGVYLLSLSSIDQPLGIILAIVPFSSPIAMPARLAAGEPAGWEIALSAVLLIATVFFVARLAATVYGRAIVRTGRRLKLREVLRTRTVLAGSKPGRYVSSNTGLR